MKWAEAPKSLQSPEYPEFGSSEPVCPHCGSGLRRFPARRSTCPKCKTPIEVAIRVLDGARVILRATDEGALQQQQLITRLLRELDREERRTTSEFASGGLASEARGPETWRSCTNFVNSRSNTRPPRADKVWPRSTDSSVQKFSSKPVDMKRP